MHFSIFVRIILILQPAQGLGPPQDIEKEGQNTTHFQHCPVQPPECHDTQQTRSHTLLSLVDSGRSKLPTAASLPSALQKHELFRKSLQSLCILLLPVNFTRFADLNLVFAKNLTRKESLFKKKLLFTVAEHVEKIWDLRKQNKKENTYLHNKGNIN